MSHSSRVIVGMSGGVDSSVAALLLQQQGYQVEGLFMKNWEEDDDEAYCAAAEDLKDAQGVCDTLGIQLHKVNFAAEYWDRVFEHFLSEYQAGRTPNPDILCNKEIKFRAFLDYARLLGADMIATGHYVRGHQGQLLRGLDPNKDQSYFLHALNQAQVSAALFPVGEMQKRDVRALAEQAGLKTHNKKDSTGICFIGERKFKDFLSRYLPAQPGEIQTPEGEVIGEHSGLMYYTLGQRQGLGIGGLADGDGTPWYVVHKDLAHNRLIAAQGHDHPLLFKPGLLCQTINWIAGAAPDLSQPLQCKTRYRQADQWANLRSVDDHWQVGFVEPQRAITPGQSIVFYQDDVCLGGGVITQAVDEITL